MLSLIKELITALDIETKHLIVEETRLSPLEKQLEYIMDKLSKLNKQLDEVE